MAVVSDKITMTFAWQGPNQWQGGTDNGGSDVRFVYLVFKDVATFVSTTLPENISPATPTEFSLKCTTPIFTSYCRVDTQANLSVTIEHIRNMTIRLGIFEKRSVTTAMATGKVTNETLNFLSEKNIPFVPPANLELGATYQLCISASKNACSYQADLVKKTSIANAVTTLTAIAEQPKASAAKKTMSYEDFILRLVKIDQTYQSQTIKDKLNELQSKFKKRNTVENLKSYLGHAQMFMGHNFRLDLVKEINKIINSKLPKQSAPK